MIVDETEGVIRTGHRSLGDTGTAAQQEV